VSYGVDYVSETNDSASEGEVQMLLTDDNGIFHEKEALTIVANFEPLISGQSVNVKYKLDRASSWTYLGAVTTVGETIARLVVSTGGSRYHEIQYGADLATTVSTSPKLLGLTIETDLHKSETRVG
jgi:ribosomal protein S16